MIKNGFKNILIDLKVVEWIRKYINSLIYILINNLMSILSEKYKN
jgi:hypothetical protein